MFKKIRFAFVLFVLSYNLSIAQQWGDYTLYSLMNGTSTYLLDTNGTAVKTWTHSSSAKSAYSCYLMPGGYLWRSVSRAGNSFQGGPIAGEIQKLDWNGNVLWDYVYSTYDYCTHHDMCPLANGNVLLISYDRISASDVSNAGCNFSGEIWCDKVVEIQPTGATTGTVVWEWRLWNHIVQNVNSNKANYQSSTVNHPELLNVNYNIQKDWIHMNGIDYNPILDQIAVSSHNMSEVYIIDHSTTTAEAASHQGGNAGKGGDFIYRWGNPAAYGASGSAILNVCHDAHWIPEGSTNAGRLVAFNNKGISNSQSSVDQFEAPRNVYNYDLYLGSAYGPSNYSNRHACNGYTSNAGNSEQLPNGNMLVCVALSGYIYEIDPNGTKLWSTTVQGAPQQVHRYNKCFTDNQPPAIPVITENSLVLAASQATTYQWYRNGSKLLNDTNQTLNLKDSGIYVVRTTDNNGCVKQYSKGYNYHYTVAAGISEVNMGNAISIYPNPSVGVFNIQSESTANFTSITVYDMQGKMMMSQKYHTNNATIDMTAFESGIYYVAFTISGGNTVAKKISLIK